MVIFANDGNPWKLTSSQRGYVSMCNSAVNCVLVLIRIIKVGLESCVMCECKAGIL